MNEQSLSYMWHDPVFQTSSHPSELTRINCGRAEKDWGRGGAGERPHHITPQFLRAEQPLIWEVLGYDTRGDNMPFDL